jgi:hypothetical protein
MATIKIIGLAKEGLGPTPLDGRYLVEYDPSRPGIGPNGEPMRAHIKTTPFREVATDFGSKFEAAEVWRKAHGIREDGKPNRPLTAYHVVIE